MCKFMHFYFRLGGILSGGVVSERTLPHISHREASGDTAIFHVETETVALIHNIHHTQYATQTDSAYEKDQPQTFS